MVLGATCPRFSRLLVGIEAQAVRGERGAGSLQSGRDAVAGGAFRERDDVKPAAALLNEDLHAPIGHRNAARRAPRRRGITRAHWRGRR